MLCAKCMKMCGWLTLAAGVAFLLVDLGVWTFWNVSWWTVVFVLVGLGKLGASKCKDCQKLMKKK